MKRTLVKILCLVLILCLFPVVGSIAQSGGMTDSFKETYEKALSLLCSASLVDKNRLEDVHQFFVESGAYLFSFEYKLFTEALLIMLEDDIFAYDDALDIIQLINGNQDFVDDYTNQKVLPALDRINQYIEARKLEYNNDSQSAIALYNEYPVLDSSERAYKLITGTKRDQYDKAMGLLQRGTIESCIEAVDLFSSLGTYRDSADQLEICRAQIEDLATPTPKPSPSPTPTPMPTPTPKPTLSPTPTQKSAIPDATSSLDTRLYREDTLDSYKYTIKSDGTAVITKYTGSESLLSIPSNIRGFIITEIGDAAFADCTSLTGIILPERIQTIGSYAFSSCTSLVDIILPKSLRTIGEHAFAYCYSLVDFYPQEGLQNIKEYAFSCCNSLVNIALPNTLNFIGEGAFNYCASITGIALPDNIRVINDNTFMACPKLANISLPDTIEIIGDAAFHTCSALSEIILPYGLQKIGNEAFSGCSALTDITLPDNLQTIDEWAFAECSALKDLLLPDSLRSIGYTAFSGCNLLTLTVYRDSYALRYAKENSIPYQYID